MNTVFIFLIENRANQRVYILDGYKQVANKAEAFQVKGAENIGVLNIVGSFTTVGSFVVGK